jgi:hypothetical protein
MPSCCLHYTCSDSHTPQQLSDIAFSRSRLLCGISEARKDGRIHIPFPAQTLYKWQVLQIEGIEDVCGVLLVRCSYWAGVEAKARTVHTQEPQKGMY